jgi:hypothetical protein
LVFGVTDYYVCANPDFDLIGLGISYKKWTKNGQKMDKKWTKIDKKL